VIAIVYICERFHSDKYEGRRLCYELLNVFTTAILSTLEPADMHAKMIFDGMPLLQDFPLILKIPLLSLII